MAFWKRKSPYIEIQKGPRVRSTALPDGTRVGDQGAENSELETLNAELTNRIAVLGDIHANLEAINAILADAKQQGVSKFICTGDVVGYGADPCACLELIRELNCLVVQGNHDQYAATEQSLQEFSLNAMNAVLWTREHLSEEEREWLNALPMTVALGNLKLETGNLKQSTRNSEPETPNCQLVHSSLNEPERWHYLLKSEKAEPALRAQGPDLVFFGHTHVPSLFSFDPAEGQFEMQLPLKPGVYSLRPGLKYAFNPGSAGQPRDRDTRAAYGIYDAGKQTVEIRRVDYDIAATQQKIEAAGLPLRNAERLSQGR